MNSGVEKKKHTLISFPIRIDKGSHRYTENEGKEEKPKYRKNGGKEEKGEFGRKE